MNMKIKVLLVDDHAMLRSGLRQTLAQHARFAVVGEAATGAAAMKLVEEAEPDLVLMDIHLPDMSGIEISRRILGDHPSIKIMVFSSDATRALVDEALQAGVCGYLSKASSVEELILAVDAVMAGKLYLSAEVSGDILKDYRKNLLEEGKAAKPLLSEHETHLLRLVAEGLRNKEIAVELNTSSKSVEAYRSRLMKKLGCASSAELVRYAVREGIVQP